MGLPPPGLSRASGDGGGRRTRTRSASGGLLGRGPGLGRASGDGGGRRARSASGGRTRSASRRPCRPNKTSSISPQREKRKRKYTLERSISPPPRPPTPSKPPQHERTYIYVCFPQLECIWYKLWCGPDGLAAQEVIDELVNSTHPCLDDVPVGMAPLITLHPGDVGPPPLSDFLRAQDVAVVGGRYQVWIHGEMLFGCKGMSAFLRETMPKLPPLPPPPIRSTIFQGTVRLTPASDIFARTMSRTLSEAEADAHGPPPFSSECIVVTSNPLPKRMPSKVSKVMQFTLKSVAPPMCISCRNAEWPASKSARGRWHCWKCRVPEGESKRPLCHVCSAATWDGIWRGTKLRQQGKAFVCRKCWLEDRSSEEERAMFADWFRRRQETYPMAFENGGPP